MQSMMGPFVRRRLGVIPVVLTLFGGCGPREPDAAEVLRRGEQAMERGSPREAVDILEAFEERTPGNPEVVEALAFAHAGVGDPMMAAFYFCRMAELKPEEPSYLLYAAQNMLAAGDAAGAILNYQRYLEQRPQDTGAWLALGELAAKQGQPDVAINAYTRALEQRPGGQPALHLGELYLARGNLALADQWFDNAAKSPGGPVAEALLGQLEVAMKLNQSPRAEALVKRLQTEFPGTLEQSRAKDIPQQLAALRAKQETERRAREEQRARQQAEAAAAAASAHADGVEPFGPDNQVQPGRLDDKETVIVRMERRQAAPPAPARPGSSLALARQSRESGDFEEAARLYRRALGELVSAEVWNEYSQVTS